MKKFPLLALIIILPALMLANAILDKSVSRPLFAPNIVKIQLTEQALQRTSLPEGLYAESSDFGLAELDKIKSAFGMAKVVRAHIRLNDKEFEQKHGVARWFLVKYQNNIDVMKALKAYKASSLIEQATPEYYAYTQAIPNDPYYPNNWGHNNTAQLPVYQSGSHSGPGVGTIGFDSNAQAAWDYPQGYGSAAIIIAIIDTGVDTSHPDLRLVTGYDYGDNDANPMDDSADPGHGTSCSGIAAGRGNNSLGIAGMAPGCSVMPLKIASSDGSLGFTAIENALYHCGNNNVDVASMSFGASMDPGDSPSTDTALAYAYSHGVAMFAATANDNSSTISYPSNHVNVISVGAASPTGQRKSTTSSDGETWWGSNYGTTTQDANTAVDVMAPTILPATDITGTGNGYNTSSDYYMWFNGTSCATPYAAGMAALVLSHTPSLTPDQLRTVITSTCTDMTVDGGAGWDRYTGYGLVNAEAALASLVPGMPTCEITSPASGTTYNLGNVITVNVTATDPTTRSIVDVKFYLDGSTTPSYTDSSSPYSWAWNTTGTTNGSHTITATATDNESNSVSDMISVTVVAPADEGFETGNFSAFAWNNTSTVPWVVQTADTFSGTYAAKSGAITDNGSTTLSLPMTISASGNISFYYKVSSESGWDFLKFYIDGVQQGSWSGTAGWAEASYPVSSGSRTFSWTYSKDSSVSSGSDCAWLDHIIFPPHGTYFAPPQNLTATAGNGSVGLSWQAPASGTPSSYKVFRNSTLLTSITGTTYTDNAVVNGTQYSYYVTAVYSSPAGESEPSNTVTATPGTIIVADFVIGSGTSSTGTSAASPINVYYENLHGQSVYTAAELIAAGVTGPCDITKIAFNVTGLPSLAMPNFVIRMAHTTATNVASWISTGLSTVWESSSYQPTATGWNQLTLTSPFTWDGTSNILIDTAFGDIGSWNQTGTVQYTTVTNGYRYIRDDDASQTDVFTGGSTSTSRPNIKITTAYIPPSPAIEVNPLSLAYGTVLINTTGSNTFQISNPGLATLSGSITTPTGYSVALGRAENSVAAEFSLASQTKSDSRNTLAYSITAGGSSTFTVTFSPTAVQAYNGNITITHNAGGANETIALTGQGGKPTIGLSATDFTATQAPNVSSFQPLSISNSGNMNLIYTLSESGSVPWLTMNGGNTVSNTINVGGAAQNINIGFHTAGMALGTYNATINCTSNDPASPSIILNLTLNVQAALIDVNPVSLDFGITALNSVTTQSFTISNSGNIALTGNITTPSGYSVAEAATRQNNTLQAQGGKEPGTSISQRNSMAYSIGAGSYKTYDLSFTPTAIQAYNGDITITHNAGGAVETIALTGQGGSATIGLSATSFSADLAPGASSSQILSISNSGNIDLTYTLTENGSIPWLTMNGANSVSNTILVGGDAQNISIGFNATGLANGTYTGTINGSSNDSAAATFSIEVILNVLSPVIVVSPNQMAFGTVRLNTTATQNFTIRNTGNALLSGTVATTSGYSVAIVRNVMSASSELDTAVPDLDNIRNTLSYSVPQGETITLAVTFAPVMIGYYSGSVTITHNAAGANRSIALSGMGGIPDFRFNPASVSDTLFIGESATHTLRLNNYGNLTAEYSMSVVGIGWLSLNGTNSISGSIASYGPEVQVPLEINATALAAGTYNATITGTSNGLNNANFIIPVMILVVDPNHAPEIDLPATFEIAKNGEITVDFSGYVSDVDNDPLTLGYIASDHVTASINGMIVTISPSGDWTGSEMLSFTVHDGSAQATDLVSVVVSNTPPLISLPDSFSFERNGSLAVDFEPFVSDANGDMLNLSYSGNVGVNISVVGSVVTFTNDPAFAGSEEITFTISDGTDSSNAVVTVTVMNNPPLLFLPATATMDQDGSLTVDYSVFVTDPDLDMMVLSSAGGSNVDVSIDGFSVTYTPALGWYGTENITFTLSDGYLESTDVVQVNVNQVISSLDTPVLNISLNAGATLLQWEAVPYANEYWIFRATDPYGTYNQIGTTSNLEFTDNDGLPKAFYQVKAVAIPIGK